MTLRLVRTGPDRVVAWARSALGGSLLGAYLHGSAVTGGLRPDSDLDLLLLTARPLSAAERTMYERARINLVSEIAPALKVSAEAAEQYLDEALAKGVLRPPKEATAAAKKGA